MMHHEVGEYLQEQYLYTSKNVLFKNNLLYWSDMFKKWKQDCAM